MVSGINRTVLRKNFIQLKITGFGLHHGHQQILQISLKQHLKNV
jgi:hypothetical protein